MVEYFNISPKFLSPLLLNTCRALNNFGETLSKKEENQSSFSAVQFGRKLQSPPIKEISVNSQSVSEKLLVLTLSSFKSISSNRLFIQISDSDRGRYKNSIFLTFENEFVVVNKIFLVNQEKVLFEVTPISANGMHRTEMENCFPNFTSYRVQDSNFPPKFLSLSSLSYKAFPMISNKKLQSLVLLPNFYGHG